MLQAFVAQLVARPAPYAKKVRATKLRNQLANRMLHMTSVG